MKTKRTVIIEGFLFAVIAAGSPVAEFMVSDRVITTRSVVAVTIVAIVAVANALKAFISKSEFAPPPPPQNPPTV